MTSAAVCAVDGCDRPVRARGWCNPHYLRWYKTGDPEKIRPARWDGYVRPECSVDGCTILAHARGLCTIHFPRMRRHGDPLAGRRPNSVGTDEERFATMFDQRGDDECWLWNAGCSTAGYGEFHLGGTNVYAHRWAYEHAVGPIPEGLSVDHVCHNSDPDCPGGVCDHRRCVNPAHLEPVTVAENFRRGRERVRL